MKWLNGYRIRLVLFGFVVAIVLGSGSVKADFTFGEPVNLGPNINSSFNEYGLSISADGLSLFFDSDRSDMEDYDLYVSTRQTTKDEWGPIANLGSTVNNNITYNEACPSISSDGLELFFSGNGHEPNGSGYGEYDLWVTRRSSLSETWSIPENLGPIVNTSYHETEPDISVDCLCLYFASNRPSEYGGWNIWVTTRKTKDDPWEEPAILGSIVNSDQEYVPNISSDGLVFFFGSNRSGGSGQCDVWMATRMTTSDQWEEPLNLGPDINTDCHDLVQYISPDGTMLYLSCFTRSGGYGWYDLWQAPVIPIVDFNGDYIVDIGDLVILIDNWGTDESLCDIAPMPWGDGIVDCADLEVLMAYWVQEILDPALLAYWKLDESEGDVAYDSSATNDAVVFGEPVWQTDGGIKDGALELDGIDDYISAPLAINPANDIFSVFAWIKGGAPGQVVLSQRSGANWLLADPSEGRLMTNLKEAGRFARPLISDAVITDGNWHHIGLTWDRPNRTLFVDDIAVATDTQSYPVIHNGELFIGAGNDLEQDSFFSGLIDDVRIYDRVIIP